MAKLSSVDMKLYKQAEIQKIFPDVPGKTLIFWARQGLVEWAAETKDARGIHREYSLWNLYQIAIVRELTVLGAAYELIRWIMDLYFKDTIPADTWAFVQSGLKRSQKASDSKVMDHILILPKLSIGRGEWLKGGPAGVKDLLGLNECIKAFKGPVYVLLNLPAIVEQIDEAMEKAGVK